MSIGIIVEYAQKVNTVTPTGARFAYSTPVGRTDCKILRPWGPCLFGRLPYHGNMSDVGSAIRELRKKAGYTQEQLAEALDYGQQYVSRVETGKRQPSWRFLTSFARLLRVPANDLLRSVGLVPDAEVDEDHIAEMIAAYPGIAAAFEYARQLGNNALLADLERYAAMLIRERGIEYDAQQSGGAAAEDEE